MRTFECICGNRLFFENTQCLACQRQTGWCPVCRSVTSLETGPGGRALCGNSTCRAVLEKCHNYSVENICNWCLPASADGAGALCASCRLTEVIPDLSVPGNREKWYRLEVAKRRLLYLLDLLRLPYGRAEEGLPLPLSFDFKSDDVPADGVWRTMSAERVYTGHLNGKITVNIREADDAEREKLRVDLHEAHRTLNGHFRHEIGHYYWQLLVTDQFEDECRQVFGNHDQPTYAESLEAYYRDGPPANWETRFISAYAAMHPWEDFAETFALYLDMADVLDTAAHADLVTSVDVRTAPLPEMLARYLALGVAANELNRSMGLIDLVPEVLNPAVCDKLAFVHSLIRQFAERNHECPAKESTSPASA